MITAEDAAYLHTVLNIRPRPYSVAQEVHYIQFLYEMTSGSIVPEGLEAPEYYLVRVIELCLLMQYQHHHDQTNQTQRAEAHT